ncbi:CdaR family transcriptional regulator [Clostridium sp. BSD9I1]|uniref:PucR family transcriptional regulator n=1 Tax=Clostridium sp. BSD9I1 TaxID=2003589 RepID=UPI0016445F80|nr:helix-turn-helix domain-containing protein [Clostridium sp. BSD9I1]
MHNIDSFLMELSNESNIKFNFYCKTMGISFIGITNKTRLMSMDLNLSDNRAVLELDEKNYMYAPLLKFTIEYNLREVSNKRENLLREILVGNDIREEDAKKVIPYIFNNSSLLVFDVIDKYKEILAIIKETYNSEDVISIYHEGNVIILGNFEDVMEHAESIRNSIMMELYCDCAVSVGINIRSILSLKRAYSNGKKTLYLKKKFQVPEGVLFSDKLFFEEIVDAISINMKNEIKEMFKNKLDNLDKEIIITIEEFINCGLNISDTAKNLYIHRNTLIYRLDKIYKDTNFDLRNFKDAIVFYVVFLLWKERV